MAPDWPAMIEQLCSTGLTYLDIGRATSSVLTDRILRHYAAGIQPLHWRGEQLILLWCSTMRKNREDVPLCAVVRGHRADRVRVARASTPVALPDWPPMQIEAPQKRKPGRPRKVVQEV